MLHVILTGKSFADLTGLSKYGSETIWGSKNWKIEVSDAFKGI